MSLVSHRIPFSSLIFGRRFGGVMMIATGGEIGYGAAELIAAGALSAVGAPMVLLGMGIALMTYGSYIGFIRR